MFHAAPSVRTWYDLALVTSFTLNAPFTVTDFGYPSFHGLTGGVYKAERIHRAMADARLLAIPAS